MKSLQIQVLGVLLLSIIGFLWGVDAGLVSLVLGSISTLLILALKRSTLSKKYLWWVWSIHLLVLAGVYMVTYGVANIVGSGRRYSARGSVSTLRTIGWAQRQCMRYSGRVCSLSELNGVTPVKGFTPTLQRPQWRTLAKTTQGNVARVGQYYYALYPLSTSSLRVQESQSLRSPPQWVAYAWPQADKTLQSYCLDDHEEILELPVRSQGSVYVGLDSMPIPQACLGLLHQNPEPTLNAEQQVALKQGQKVPPSTHVGQDQQVWYRWRGKRTRYARSLDRRSQK